MVAEDIKDIKNRNTFEEKLKSIKDTIIRTSFKKGTTFNKNKDINYLYFGDNFFETNLNIFCNIPQLIDRSFVNFYLQVYIYSIVVFNNLCYQVK